MACLECARDVEQKLLTLYKYNGCSKFGGLLPVTSSCLSPEGTDTRSLGTLVSVAATGPL